MSINSQKKHIATHYVVTYKEGILDKTVAFHAKSIRLEEAREAEIEASVYAVDLIKCNKDHRSLSASVAECYLYSEPLKTFDKASLERLFAPERTYLDSGDPK